MKKVWEIEAEPCLKTSPRKSHLWRLCACRAQIMCLSCRVPGAQESVFIQGSRAHVEVI